MSQFSTERNEFLKLGAIKFERRSNRRGYIDQKLDIAYDDERIMRAKDISNN